jgi:hypothetical protein
MTTLKEFTRSGITGQTFREITEKFGKPFNALGESDAVMSTYAVAYAWIREREHLPVPDAFNKAMTWTIDQIEGVFEDGTDPEVKKEEDFASPPHTTTP